MPFFLVLALSLANATPTEPDQRLRSSTAEASSFVYDASNRHLENYHPNYVLDDNPKTAWTEGVEGPGIGEHLSVPLVAPGPVGTLTVRIRNGYQKSSTLLTANGAPTRLRLELVDRAGGLVSNTEHDLSRRSGWQTFAVVVPETNLARATFTILEVVPGRVYQDTCISDIQLLVDADAPYNGEAQARLHHELEAWISGRQAAASADNDKRAFFASATFEAKDREASPPDTVDGRMAPYRVQAKALGDADRWFKVEPVRTAPDRPDGVPELSDVLTLLHTDSFALAEASGRFQQYEQVQAPMASAGEAWTANYAVERSAESPERVLALAQETRYTLAGGRGSWDTREQRIMRYDHQGRLSELWTRYSKAGDDRDGYVVNESRETLVELHYDTNGQVDKLRVWTLEADEKTGSPVHRQAATMSRVAR